MSRTPAQTGRSGRRVPLGGYSWSWRGWQGRGEPGGAKGGRAGEIAFREGWPFLGRVSVLVLNAGSTSLKFGLFGEDAEPWISAGIDWADGRRDRARLHLRVGEGVVRSGCVEVPDDDAAAACAWQAVREAAGLSGAHGIRVAGHRVVHGGSEFHGSALIDARVKAILERLGRLAPLHNPPALRTIAALEALLPGVPQVAVFDTAFFAALPPRATVYPVPWEWSSKWGIRRFGFHGLSHAWCAERAAELLSPRDAPLRLVICHLGGGCSAAAVRGGKPVATTMGFTPLEGLMMATRSGSVDAGVLIHLQRECGLSWEDLEEGLHHSSGLLGVSGVSPDWTEVECAAARGNERAVLACEVFVDRVRGAIGSLAATLGGLDALVFTDRIGAGSPSLRAAVCENLGFLGVKLDAAANEGAGGDADIALAGSPVRILVLRTQEERMVAREALRCLAQREGLERPGQPESGEKGSADREGGAMG